MYLQIKHKIQSVDPGLCLDPSQSCRSGKESDSKQTHLRCEVSCWLTVNTALRSLHYSHEEDCVFSDRSKILCKHVALAFLVPASSTSWRHLSDFQVGVSREECDRRCSCGRFRKPAKREP